MSRGAHFKQEELDFIKVNALVKSTKEIAEALGRNYWAVFRKMKDFGIKSNHKFTTEDDFLIRQMYGKFTAKVIATKIGVDEMSIYNRIKSLKLKKRI